MVYRVHLVVVSVHDGQNPRSVDVARSYLLIGLQDVEHLLERETVSRHKGHVLAAVQNSLLVHKGGENVHNQAADLEAQRVPVAFVGLL